VRKKSEENARPGWKPSSSRTTIRPPSAGDAGTLETDHLTDSRRGENLQFPFAGLLRHSAYNYLGGYENLDDT
jgi:hypothetical protein